MMAGMLLKAEGLHRSNAFGMKSVIHEGTVAGDTIDNNT